MAAGRITTLLTQLANLAIQAPPEPSGDEGESTGAPAANSGDTYIPEPELTTPVVPSDQTGEPNGQVDRALNTLMNALGQFDLSSKKNRDMAVSIITHSKHAEVKEAMMAGLATVIHNNPDTEDASKEGVRYIFDKIAESNDANTFNAGISAVASLKGIDTGPSGNDLYEKYINNYIKNAPGTSNIGSRTDIGNNFLQLIQSYVRTHPGRFGRIITSSINAWFSSPDKAGLWQAAMIISKADGKCTITVGGRLLENVPFGYAVMESLRTRYRDREDKENIAVWVARQLDPGMIENSGVDDLVMANLGLGTTPRTHDVFLKEILLYPRNARIAEVVLEGIKPNRLTFRNKDSMIKTYATIIEGFQRHPTLRNTAINQAVGTHNFHVENLPYLIHDDQEDLRDPSYRFYTDYKPVGEQDSPIIQWGITQIGEAEEIFERLGNTTGPIKEQSVDYLNIQYDEYYKHANLLGLSVGGNLAGSYFDLRGDPFEHNISSGDFQIEYSSPQLYPGMRFNAELYLSTSGELLSYGLSGGIGIDLSKKLYLTAKANLGWIEIETTDDDHPASLMTPTEKLGDDGDYKAITTRPHIMLEAFELSATIALDYTIHRWKLGDGITFSLGPSVAYNLGFLFGGITDLVPQRAINPQGKEVVCTANTRECTLTGDEEALVRNGKDSTVLIQGLDLGIFGRVGFK